MTCCTCITAPFLGAIGHQVLAIAGIVPCLTLFSLLEECDKRSQAAKLKACSGWSVSDLSHRFFDAFTEKQPFLAL
jgi:hypothetical protein